jgi:hypothetical protein
MKNDVNKFVEKCRICQHAKGRSQNTRLYHSLPIQNRPWDSIIMEFVLVLPKTQKGNDSIYVLVDRIKKNGSFFCL